MTYKYVYIVNNLMTHKYVYIVNNLMTYKYVYILSSPPTQTGRINEKIGRSNPYVDNSSSVTGVHNVCNKAYLCTV